MYPHRIRLRGPWDCEPLARLDSGGPLPPKCRMTMPCRLGEGGLGDFAGQVRFRRRFGFPGRLDPHEHVWLTFAGIVGRAEIELNGKKLGSGADGPFEFEITGLLAVRNELTVDLTADGGNDGLWGEVALEVRGPVFLRDVRVQRGSDGRLRVTGVVAGASERPLELYIVVAGETRSYTSQAAAQPFCIDVDAPGEKPPVRVELVGGAMLWHAVEPACENAADL
jgi:hypothetical protein